MPFIATTCLSIALILLPGIGDNHPFCGCIGFLGIFFFGYLGVVEGIMAGIPEWQGILPILSMGSWIIIWGSLGFCIPMLVTLSLVIIIKKILYYIKCVFKRIQN